MTGTRYVVVGSSAILLFMLGLLAGQLLGDQSDTSSSQNAPSTTLVDPVSGRPVTVAQRPDTTPMRETIRETLLTEGSIVEPWDESLVPDQTETNDTDGAEVDDIVVPGPLLGDGNITTNPQVGHIYSCQQQFNGGGAHAVGDWIDGAYWYPESKVLVDGAIPWASDVTITKVEGARLISANGLPSHTTGIFPIAATDDAYQYDRNPNSINAQSVTLQLPLLPTRAAAPSCTSLGAIGVALNGVAIYNGLDGQGLDAAAHEIQDSCGGHPERTGEYHYHSESECLVNSFYEGAESTLVGYALDGFGIFSSLEYGETLTNADLDACHGHTHQIPWDGVYENLYHYHMTKEYPYTVGCFMGTPQSIVSSNQGSANTDSPAPNSELPPPPPGGQLPPPPPQ